MSMRRLDPPVQVLVPGPLKEGAKGGAARKVDAPFMGDSDFDEDDEDGCDSDHDDMECEDDGEGHCCRCGRPLEDDSSEDL